MINETLVQLYQLRNPENSPVLDTAAADCRVYCFPLRWPLWTPGSLVSFLCTALVAISSSNIWNCYKWAMISRGFRREVAKCSHLSTLHTLDLLALTLRTTPRGSYRKETECCCRAVQSESMHFSQLQAHLFSNSLSPPPPASSLTAASESELMI